MSLSRLIIASLSITALPFAALAQAAPAVPAAPAPVPAAAAIPAPPSMPATVASGPVTRQELPALIKEVLMNEPEMVMDAVKKLREKQQAEAKKKTDTAIAANKEALLNDADTPSIGEKTADITVVEFFDYHCGYCKHMLPVITQLTSEDKKVRVVFKEFPILSEDSVTAARAALAVNRIAKDKYFAFHSALMKHEGAFDEKSLMDIAKKQGISADALKAEMAKPEVTAALDKSRKLGEEIGVRGTPALIVGNHFMPGAADLDTMKKSIADIRAGKKPGEEIMPAAGAPAIN